MKEEKKVYALFVIASIVRHISMMRINYYEYIVKRKKQMIRNHLKFKKHNLLLLNRLLPPYIVMYWLELEPLKTLNIIRYIKIKR